jgi:hypothetical protein
MRHMSHVRHQKQRILWDGSPSKDFHKLGKWTGTTFNKNIRNLLFYFKIKISGEIP